MSWKRTLYILLIILVAGVSALGGVLAGGVAVYRATRQNQPAASASPSVAQPELLQATWSAKKLPPPSA